MNFTAFGYARLTDLLAPDIVVLEGGYSIEGALPYVNVGILLALAGLDYSAVREPDWDPEIARQPRASNRRDPPPHGHIAGDVGYAQRS